MLVALWLMLTMNATFWSTVWQGVDGWSNGNTWFLVSLPLVVFFWLFGLLSLLCWGRATKVMLAAFLLISAAGSYFMSSYGVVIDYSMLTNLLQTDPAEVADLLTWRLVGWMALLGVLPVVVLSRARLLQRGWKRELWGKLGGIALALVCIGTMVGSSYQSYSSLVRNNREIRLMLVPSNLVAAAHGYLKRNLSGPHKLQAVGADAYRLLPGGKPKVTVLVVGETARAANFSLNGYARDTNPELAQRGVMNFTNASSCGTATATSVPCMFQDVGRENYQDSYADSREDLLDVLQRAGIAVLWRDNNSGCKGACSRVQYEDVSHIDQQALCADGECHDGVLLKGLQAYLDGIDRDAVIVLHMKGSHGPAYYKRYPSAFEKFTPVCRSSQLDQCSRESIINAYDNTLTYTDHVLAQTIDLLQHNAGRLDTAMLYLSDHGESLGENGIYLHGLPYAMAPQEQTHIPMLLWLSKGMEKRQDISVSCLDGKLDQAASQDNLFHSVLGLMDVHTKAYQPALDLFRSCRPEPEGVYAQHSLQPQPSTY
ncbi:phosphoethanolamine--lipid A transferase [Pseudomonas sp. N040]|nr:phosphoethanolamine--lipid A transferase [Pseudomonas sp. N040]MBW7013856.1 phosphoethanolamine--lipid A transferase [Pseudomonas sp. N040]